LATSTNFWKVSGKERYPYAMTIVALPFQLRTGRPDDALAILEAQRSAIRQTAVSAYSPAIIDEWAPAVIVRERVEKFQRWIERGEELIVVAMEPAGQIIGFGSIVPANSELRAVYVAAAYGSQGVGRALFARLEELARDAGLAELRMDASINAVAFYEANGFISLEHGEHFMPSGGRMACVRMRKALRS
jgi:putative acetyltransferase